MPIALLLAAATPDLIAAARARTAAEPRCERRDTTDITVCSLRAADRYRVPLLTTGPIPERANVPLERQTLLHRTTPIQDMGPFLVGGGAAGVTMSTSFGASGSETHVRQFAP